MSNVAFYISGHGYGHAARMAEVIQCFLDLQPQSTLFIRTTAPEWLFPFSERADIHCASVALDAGVAEGADSLHIDPTGTLELAEEVESNREHLIASEAAFVRREKIDLLVADIPYLAGDISAAAQIPCIGISNFTWDFIYEPHFAGHPRGKSLLESIQRGYAKMHTFLKLPFGHSVNTIRRVIDVPLVARRSKQDPEAVLRLLPFRADDPRPRVLLGMRGALSPELLDSAARGGPNFLFLNLGNDLAGAPDNLCHLPVTLGLSFPDLMSLCSIVIAKLGYGIISDAIVNRTSVLYPPRSGFREDELLREGAAHYLRAKEIPLIDFRSGNWSPYLWDLLEGPEPERRTEANGAQTCAELLHRHLTSH